MIENSTYSRYLLYINKFSLPLLFSNYCRSVQLAIHILQGTAATHLR